MCCTDAVAATIAAFGPIKTLDLKRCMRQGHNSINNSLQALQHSGEINRLQPQSGGRPSAIWVAI
jgi:hypothetical protein